MERNPIDQSMQIAIFTQYYGPTDHRGSRIKAFTVNGHKLWTSFYAGGARDDAHNYAARRLCEKMGWSGPLLRANTNKGAVYIFTPEGSA